MLPQNPDRFTRFRLLLVGKFVSDLGTYIDFILFPVYVYQLTRSGLATGFFMICRFGGGVTFGLVSGILADRFHRKSLMVAADAIRCLVLLPLLVLPETWHYPVLCASIFVIGAAQSLFEVSLNASIPVMLGKARRVRANAVLSSLQSVAMAIGCLAGGALATRWGYRSAFALDAVSYLVSGVNLLFLSLHTEGPRGERDPAFFREFFEDFSAVWKELRLQPILMAFMGVRLLDCFGSSGHNIGLPILSVSIDPVAPALLVGLIYAAWAGGKLSLATFLQRTTFLKATGRIDLVFAISTAAMSVTFVLLFYVPPIWPLLLVAVMAGMADGGSEVCYVSRLQRTEDRSEG